MYHKEGKSVNEKQFLPVDFGKHQNFIVKSDNTSNNHELWLKTMTEHFFKVMILDDHEHLIDAFNFNIVLARIKTDNLLNSLETLGM